MGRLNPETRTPPPPVPQKPVATIGPLAVDPSSVGSFVDFLRQATMVVDQITATPMTPETRPTAAESSSPARGGTRVSRSTTPTTRASGSSTAGKEPAHPESGRGTDTSEAPAARAGNGERAAASPDGKVATSSSAHDVPRSNRRGGAADTETPDVTRAAEAGHVAAAVEATLAVASEIVMATAPETLETVVATASEDASDQQGGVGRGLLTDIEPDMPRGPEAPIEEPRPTKAPDAVSPDTAIERVADAVTTLDPMLQEKVETALQSAPMAVNDGKQRGRASRGEVATEQPTAQTDGGPDLENSPNASSHAMESPLPTLHGENAAAAVMAASHSSGPSPVMAGSGDPSASTHGVVTSPAGAKTTEAGRTAADSPTADPTAHVDRAKLIQRVARAFHSMAQQEGSVRLKLHPEELGSLTIRVGILNRTMTAHIETESAATQKLLMENLGQLRDRLAEQNIKIDRFEVVCTGTQGGTSGDAQRHDNGSKARPSEHEPRGDRNTPEPESLPRARRIAGQGMLDLLG